MQKKYLTEKYFYLEIKQLEKKRSNEFFSQYSKRQKVLMFDYIWNTAIKENNWGYLSLEARYLKKGNKNIVQVIKIYH